MTDNYFIINSHSYPPQKVFGTLTELKFITIIILNSTGYVYQYHRLSDFMK